MKNTNPDKVRTKDLPVLIFIWRWKLATTAAITARFYPDYRWNPQTTYWRLWQLKKRGLVTLIYVGLDQDRAWSLTQRGLKCIRGQLPMLKEQGFATENPAHDLMVAAVHLGDFLPRHSTKSVSTFTEQELRRIDRSCYPQWVPDTTLHRPDGYWNLPRDNSRAVVALEVELSSKTTEQYAQIANFYNSSPEIDGVLWVIESQSLATKIQNLAKRGPYKFRDIHQFVEVNSFRASGWQAPIFLGSLRDQKLSEFLIKSYSTPAPPLSQPSPTVGWTFTILDARVKHPKTRTCTDHPAVTDSLLYTPKHPISILQTE